MFLQGQRHGYRNGYLNGREIGLWVKEPRKQRNASDAKWEKLHDAKVYLPPEKQQQVAAVLGNQTWRCTVPGSLSVVRVPEGV